MEMSETIADLATALAKAQADLDGAAKKSNNPAFRSKYADLGAVWDAWQEVGPKNGLSVVQFPTDMPDAKMVGMTTMLMHTSGQWMRGIFSLPASKQDAHGYGSAVTYLRRFSLASVVGVCPVDDDGNAAAKAAPKAANAEPATLPANLNPGVDEPGGDDDRAALAKEWADKQSVLIDGCLKGSDFDRLKQWRTKEGKALERMHRNHPEIHERLIALFDDVYSELSASLRMAG